MSDEQGTLNVDTGGSSDRKNTVCGTSDASDQPAEIGGRGFDSSSPVSTHESPSGQPQRMVGDGNTCDRCPAFAPWSIGDYEDDAFSAVTRWFACNRHLAAVMREANWTLDAVEVRYLTAEQARDAL